MRYFDDLEILEDSKDLGYLKDLRSTGDLRHFVEFENYRI